MQAHTLNKVIALFLSGGAALFLISVVHWQQLSQILPLREGEADAGAWVLVGLIFFPLAALVGAVAEGLSEITVQRLVKRSETSRNVAAVFFRAGAKGHLDRWKVKLAEVAQTHPSFRWLGTVTSQEQPWWLHSTVAGTFLQRSTPELFRWLVQHYSTYILAANMAFVLASGMLYVAFASVAARLGWWWPVLMPTGPGRKLLLLLAAGCSLWALLSHAVGRYLYSHELSTRHVVLWIVNHATGEAKDSRS